MSWNPTLYWERKAAGVCVRGTCGRPAGDESVLCAAHHADQLRFGAASRSKPKVKAWQRVLAKAHRKRRIADGKCGQCAAPAVTETLCERCRRRKIELQAPKAPTPKKQHHCSTCGEPGHRYQTCAIRPSTSVDVIAYASARNNE